MEADENKRNGELVLNHLEEEQSEEDGSNDGSHEGDRAAPLGWSSHVELDVVDL